jgi:hypothetical protein
VWRKDLEADDRVGLLTEAKLHKICAFPDRGPRAEVDTVRVTWPATEVEVEGARASVPEWGSDRGVTFSRKLEGGGMMFSGVGGVVAFEGSLPKRLGDDNVEPLGLVDATAALRDAFDEVSQFASIESRFDHGHVTRLDLVRTFRDVESFPVWAEGVRAVRTGGRVHQFLHSDAQFAGALTVGAGAKTSWSAYAYDKHFESKGLADPGTIRFESRLRSKVLVSKWASNNGGCVDKIVDLDEVKLRSLTRASFGRVGFDREVKSMRAVAELVGESSGLSPRERMAFLGYLWGQAVGVPMGSRNTLAKYERVARNLGVTVPKELLAADEAVSISLDFDRGCEVVRAA